jgi:hypothetical protein
MSRLGPEESCSAALYVLKTYQDLLKRGLDKKDLDTTRIVLKEVSKAFRSFVDDTRRDDLRLLQLYVEREPEGMQRDSAVTRLRRAEQLHSAAKRISLARDQVIFGLAAIVLKMSRGQASDTSLHPMFAEYSRHLPSTLDRLTEVLGSLSDREAVDFWGWDWWDLQPDGEAHAIDSHSKLNSLYCVKALDILAALSPDGRQQLRLPHSHSLAYLADPSNAQGLVQMLNTIETSPQEWPELLAPQLAQISTLRGLLNRAKADQEKDEEDQLIAATLDAEKLREFKLQVVEGIQIGGHLKALLRKFGKVVTRESSDSKKPLAWGFNQLENKGPFVKSDHRGYAGWGEAYGRGLAQAENNRAFSAMAEGARRLAPVLQERIVETVEDHVDHRNIDNTVLLQSLIGSLEFEGIRRRDFFIPKYHADCPRTRVSDVNGFMGVLKLAKGTVPVFDVAVQARELVDTIVVADLSRFIQWTQYPASDDVEDKLHVVDSVLIRVRDLNSDENLRTRLLAEDPGWLRDKVDKERFLRSHVTINVTEAFELEVLDRTAAVSFVVMRGGNQTDD